MVRSAPSIVEAWRPWWKERRIIKGARWVESTGSRQFYAFVLLVTTGCSPRGRVVVPAEDFSGANRRASVTEHYTTAGEDRPALRDSRLVSSPGEKGQLPAEFQPRAATRLWRFIVLHHSATADGDVRRIDINHRGRVDSKGEPWLGIGYHFVIGNGGAMGDGAVEPTFRWRDQLQGAHAGSRLHNEEGIGICLIGDFDKAPPTPRQVDAARKLVATLAARFTIARINCVRHSDINETACPGRLFPYQQIVAD